MRRLAAEFVVIVAGVFLALAAESWWSDREARTYELELRNDMREEFEQNVAILESDLDENAGALRTIEAITKLSPAELANLGGPEAAQRFDAVTNLVTAGFDPAMGSAQALVSSGDLGAITDPALRAALAHWTALLEEKERFTRNHTNYALSVEVPALARMGRDGQWSAEERMEARSLLEMKRLTAELMVQNQRRLRELAGEILALLGDGQ